MSQELSHYANQHLDQAREFAGRLDWKFISRELSVFGAGAATAYTQLYYHITRFARDSLMDLPFGEFMTKHAGNMGPSSDIAIWGTLAGEVVKTIGKSKENMLLTQVGDKVFPALTLGYIYWLNYLSEASVPINPEGNLDMWAGVAVGALSILAIKGIANRIRQAPHEINQDNP